MDIGSNIRGLRTARGLTQEQLARALYVSRQTISNWESAKTVPDAQSLLMMSVLFSVSVDTLMKGDVQIMTTLTLDQRRRERISYLAGAGVGLAGAAAVAHPLVQAAGPATGLVLAAVPVATALAAAALANARAREGASLGVLREALAGSVSLVLEVRGRRDGLAARARDGNGAEAYRIELVARVPRGRRWVVSAGSGTRVAAVAYRLVTAGVQYPAIEARIDGLGKISLEKRLVLGQTPEGLADVWRLDGCGLGVEGDWLGREIRLTREGAPIAELRIEDAGADGRDYHLRVRDGALAGVAVTLAFLLALLQDEERPLT